MAAERSAEPKEKPSEKPAAARKRPSTEALGPEWRAVEPVLLHKGEKTEVWLRAVGEKGAVLEVRHAQWEEPALVKIEPRKSGRGEQLRGVVFASAKRPLETLKEAAEELKAAGVPSVGVFNEGVQFGSSSVDYLMLRDKRAAELWFGEVLYWDDEVRIFLRVVDESHEDYTIAVNDAGWHIYTLAFTRRRRDKWEGVIYTSDPEAPDRVKKALLKIAEDTPWKEHVEKWKPTLGKAARTNKITVGGWARKTLHDAKQAKKLKNSEK
ncbi:MAG: hypothetical protein ABWK05_04955 [Pyrobaculum sp.]